MHSVIEETDDKALEIHAIGERLEQIRLYLEKEVAFKQRIIEGLEEQVIHLKAISEEKNSLLGKLETQLLECRQTNEGTRQLINKLLNDISNYQKDIEWYKRTYVKRSLPGTIWQKLFRK
jgi:uncharacterized coiled-coil protein SlyX